MGLAVAILCAAIMVILVFLKRDAIPYVILFFLIFFSEAGEGFTSFNASFVFNQDFIRFANLRFIEFIIGPSYLAMWLIPRSSNESYMSAERNLFIGCAMIIAVLSLVEYFQHGTVTVSDWRLMVSGIMAAHLFVRLLDTEEKIIKFMIILVVMLGLRALIGLVAYLLGHGVVSPRGMVPFFWDSRQVAAFAYAIIILTSYASSFNILPIQQRILPRWFAYTLLIILGLTVLLSIRRTAWAIALGGVGLVLLLNKSVKIAHYMAIGFFAAFLLIVIFTVPIFDGVQNKAAHYFESVNLFDEKVAESYENRVHTDNVKQYTRMIEENTSVLLMGYRGYPGENYSRLPEIYSEEFPLGVAHNAILRTIYFYGISGIVIYLLFFLLAMMQYKYLSNKIENSLVKQVALASFVMLFLEFSTSLTLVPPFYTTTKGLMYTFIAVIFVRYGAQKQAVSAGIPLKEKVEAVKKRDNIVRRKKLHNLLYRGKL